MDLYTSHFGEIKIKDEETITFHDGLPGFEDYKKFVIIKSEGLEVPFYWMQSAEKEDLAFVLLDPFVFKKNYSFELNKTVVDKLVIEKPEDVAVFSVVVIPEDISKMTANLLAPIVINIKSMQGKQVVLDSNEYHTKHLILEEMKNVG